MGIEYKRCCTHGTCRWGSSIIGAVPMEHVGGGIRGAVPTEHVGGGIRGAVPTEHVGGG